jgi:putative phage-type endonuclease
MKVLDIEQNTPEWYELRRSMIGASDIATIMAGSKNEIYDLYLEKVNGQSKFATRAMIRGKEMEAEARAWMNLTQEFDFEPLVGVSKEHPWLMASFDGFNRDRKIALEIKCPLKVEFEIQDHPHYKRWWWQIQAQYAVSGVDNILLLVYSPESRVYAPVPKYYRAIDELLEKGKEFYDRVINYDPPEEDIEEKTDEISLNLAYQWIKAKEAKDAADIAEEEARQALVNLADGKSFKAGHVRVQKMCKRGAIEYRQVIELKDVDLEKYRKGSVTYWKLDFSK